MTRNCISSLSISWRKTCPSTYMDLCGLCEKNVSPFPFPIAQKVVRAAKLKPTNQPGMGSICRALKVKDLVCDQETNVPYPMAKPFSHFSRWNNATASRIWAVDLWICEWRREWVSSNLIHPQVLRRLWCGITLAQAEMKHVSAFQMQAGCFACNGLESHWNTEFECTRNVQRL